MKDITQLHEHSEQPTCTYMYSTSYMYLHMHTSYVLAKELRIARTKQMTKKYLCITIFPNTVAYEGNTGKAIISVSTLLTTICN